METFLGELILVQGVIIWLGCAFACSFIAKKKYRSGIGWFFAGLFTGAIGLVVILSLNDKY